MKEMPTDEEIVNRALHIEKSTSTTTPLPDIKYCPFTRAACLSTCMAKKENVCIILNLFERKFANG